MVLLLGPDGAPIQRVDPVTKAAMEFVGKVGAKQFIMKTLDGEGLPTAHVAIAFWITDLGQLQAWETASGRTRAEAAHRLIKQIASDATCANEHCKRPVEVDDDGETPWSEREFDAEYPFCVLTFDPETTTYRRCCDGA